MFRVFDEPNTSLQCRDALQKALGVAKLRLAISKVGVTIVTPTHCKVRRALRNQQCPTHRVNRNGASRLVKTSLTGLSLVVVMRDERHTVPERHQRSVQSAAVRHVSPSPVSQTRPSAIAMSTKALVAMWVSSCVVMVRPDPCTQLIRPVGNVYRYSIPAQRYSACCCVWGTSCTAIHDCG